MGENVELDVFLKRTKISLKDIFSILAKENLQISIKNMSVFDDWKYTNETNIDVSEIDKDMSDILWEKFARVFFVVDGKWKCTLLTSFLDVSVINLSFSLDIGYFSQESSEYNTEPGKMFLLSLYEKVVAVIDHYIYEYPFKGCFLTASMGVEYSVEFYDDPMAMLTADNGVQKWILPKISGEQIHLRFFLKEEKGNSFIFTFIGRS